MKRDFILVYDSGIGGLSVLKELLKYLPYENYIYFGDNKNAPYGEKNKRELLELTFNNIFGVKSDYKIKAIVLACNTLSMSVRNEIERLFNLPVFGVFPPVERFLIEGKKTLLIATSLTAKYFQKQKNLYTMGLKDLAFDIENNIYHKENIDIKKHLVNLKKQKFDCVVLGCTHYSFVKNKIIDHLKTTNVYGGEKFTAIKVAKDLINLKSSDKNRRNKVLFLGENSIMNKKVWDTKWLWQ